MSIETLSPAWRSEKSEFPFAASFVAARQAGRQAGRLAMKISPSDDAHPKKIEIELSEFESIMVALLVAECIHSNIHSFFYSFTACAQQESSN